MEPRRAKHMSFLVITPAMKNKLIYLSQGSGVIRGRGEISEIEKQLWMNRDFESWTCVNIAGKSLETSPEANWLPILTFLSFFLGFQVLERILRGRGRMSQRYLPPLPRLRGQTQRSSNGLGFINQSRHDAVIPSLSIGQIALHSLSISQIHN